MVRLKFQCKLMDFLCQTCFQMLLTKYFCIDASSFVMMGNKNNPITLNATELNVAQKYITKKTNKFLFLQKKVIMERP